jgi:hypothetical protein
MRLLRKLIKFTETEIADKFAENEIAAYDKIKEDSFASADSFVNKTGRRIFDLSFIYPLRDDGFAQRLLPLQNRIADILEDNVSEQGHFYQSAEDLHLTLLCCTKKSHLLSEAHKQQHREKALDFFLNPNREELFIKPKIYFYGGSAAQDAVIIHGYNFTELNNSRVALARYGFQHGLFDRKLGFKYAWQILQTDTVYPDIAHLSFVRLGRAITEGERLQINELLDSRDFGEAVFPELGLYEFSRWGVFSSGRGLANLIFGSDSQ